MFKKCTRCKIEKSLDNFSRDKSKPDGMCSWCKDCHKQYHRDNKKRNNARSRAWRRRNPDWQKNWRIQHPEYAKEYYHRDIEKSRRRSRKTSLDFRRKNYKAARAIERRYENKRYHSDPEYRLIRLMRSRMNLFLKDKKKGRTWKIVGMTPSEFMRYIEQCDTWDPQWTWDDYGIKWNIDHIIPVSKWRTVFKTVEDAFHYSNCQPMLIKDNLRKGNKINDQGV